MEEQILASSGYLGHFNQDLYNPFSKKSANTIRFQGVDLFPYVRFDSKTNSSTTVLGPWFSLLYETALNYSLDCKSLEGMSENEIRMDFLLYQPDLLLSPFLAQIDTLMLGLELDFLTYSDMIITLEMDHIMTAKSFERKSLMALLAPFDNTSLFLVAVSLFILSCLVRHSRKTLQELNLNNFIWNLMTSLINPVKVETKKGIWRFIGLTWVLGVFFLQQLFSGDMYTAMALLPGLDVIDNFDDLALKSEGPITAFDSIVSDINNYISPYREHREALVTRIQILPAEQGMNPALIEEILANVSGRIQYHLGPLQALNYYRDVLFKKKYQELIYISKEFGQPMPVFLIVNTQIEKKVLDTFNEIIVFMRENGIFDKWVGSHLKKWDDDEGDVESEVIVDFSQAQLSHFDGLFVICLCLLLITFFVFTCELLGKKKKLVEPASDVDFSKNNEKNEKIMKSPVPLDTVPGTSNEANQQKLENNVQV